MKTELLYTEITETWSWRRRRFYEEERLCQDYDVKSARQLQKDQFRMIQSTPPPHISSMRLSNSPSEKSAYQFLSRLIFIASVSHRQIAGEETRYCSSNRNNIPCHIAGCSWLWYAIIEKPWEGRRCKHTVQVRSNSLQNFRTEFYYSFICIFCALYLCFAYFKLLYAAHEKLYMRCVYIYNNFLFCNLQII